MRSGLDWLPVFLGLLSTVAWASRLVAWPGSGTVAWTGVAGWLMALALCLAGVFVCLVCVEAGRAGWLVELSSRLAGTVA